MEELKKRLISFLWRFGGMAVIAILAFISSNLDLVKLSPEVVALIGLVINEITKSLNTYFSLDEKIAGVIKKLSGRK